MRLATQAHAKINPYLWVGDLQADGFHEIDTVLQAIDLHDVLTFSTAAETTVRCSMPQLDGKSNLVYKAYRFASEVAELPTLDIFIEKSIPTQAGLGGGSSDAAAALRVFNRLTHGVIANHLHEIALACGSDVPFFLGSATRARATGRGERLERMDNAGEQPLVLAMPAMVSCNTAGAYRRLDEVQNRPNERPKTMPYNDFERVAPCESLELLERIRCFGISDCGLCGSGSAVYGYTEDSEGIASVLRSNSVWAVATKTITSFGDVWTP